MRALTAAVDPILVVQWIGTISGTGAEAPALRFEKSPVWCAGAFQVDTYLVGNPFTCIGVKAGELGLPPFDPLTVPGTGSPVPELERISKVLRSLWTLGKTGAVTGAEKLRRACTLDLRTFLIQDAVTLICIPLVILFIAPVFHPTLTFTSLMVKDLYRGALRCVLCCCAQGLALTFALVPAVFVTILGALAPFILTGGFVPHGLRPILGIFITIVVIISVHHRVIIATIAPKLAIMPLVKSVAEPLLTKTRTRRVTPLLSFGALLRRAPLILLTATGSLIIYFSVFFTVTTQPLALLFLLTLTDRSIPRLSHVITAALCGPCESTVALAGELVVVGFGEHHAIAARGSVLSEDVSTIRYYVGVVVAPGALFLEVFSELW
jgi:hypothetical protein